MWPGFLQLLVHYRFLKTWGCECVWSSWGYIPARTHKRRVRGVRASRVSPAASPLSLLRHRLRICLVVLGYIPARGHKIRVRAPRVLPAASPLSLLKHRLSVWSQVHKIRVRASNCKVLHCTPSWNPTHLLCIEQGRTVYSPPWGSLNTYMYMKSRC